MRLIDPVDAPPGQPDLIAVYIRQSPDSLQVRLDLLESRHLEDLDIYLLFDHAPGGADWLPAVAEARTQWDTLLSAPAHGSITVEASTGVVRSGAGVLVWRDPGKEAVIFDLNPSAVSDRLAGYQVGIPLSVQVLVTSPGSRIVSDQTALISAQGLPPKPARAMLAFWNAFPAYTPATALRRWDGAHTGPLGGRHGLYNLLRTAKAAEMPLFLLDLNEPAALSALAFTGGLELVQEIQSAELLYTPRPRMDPETGPAELAILAETPDEPGIEPGWRLPSRGWVFAPAGAPLSSGIASRIFLRQQTGSLPGESLRSSLAPERWKNLLVFELMEMEDRNQAPLQANWEGLTVEWKQVLVQAALDENASDHPSAFRYVPLGGNLPASTWGDPRSARAAFQWLRQHPWVQVVGLNELNAARPGPAPADPSGSLALAARENPGADSELLRAFGQTPESTLKQAAWQAYRALFASVYPAPPELPELRANYTRQVWSLLAAARWAANPQPIADCESDPDRDGLPNCVLATQRYYAQFETGDGALTYLFGFGSPASNLPPVPEDIHQIIGPSSQLISGLSQAAEWDLSAGLRADPQVISGAFSGPGQGYQAGLAPDGSLLLIHPEENLAKRFRFSNQGLSVQYQPLSESSQNSWRQAVIPVLLDPWRRFNPYWQSDYQAFISGQTFLWRIENGPAVTVRSNVPLDCAHFLESLPLFDAPEDPNLDYPPGHFLPFPLAKAELEARPPFEVEILLEPAP